MSISSFLQTLDSIQSPCKKYACQKQDECKTKKLACTSFLVFVETGRVFSPFDHFKFISHKDVTSERLDFVKPTRENYMRMRSEDPDEPQESRTERADKVVFFAVVGGVPNSVFPRIEGGTHVE